MANSGKSHESVLTLHDLHSKAGSNWHLAEDQRMLETDMPRMAQGQLRLPSVQWGSYDNEGTSTIDDIMRGERGFAPSIQMPTPRLEGGMTASSVRPATHSPCGADVVDRDSSHMLQEHQRSSADDFAATVPKMRVCLFGGLRVYVGGEQIDEAVWTKNKTKVLFAHLVVRFGRDVGREILTELLWPESGEKRAVENLYVTWALLKKALGSDESRPYVISHGTLYRINSDLVDSDVHEFDSLARKMLFEDADEATKRKIFMRMDELYTGDLMSGVRCDPHLERVRSRYRDTYVDVLVAAANLMLKIGNTAEALWFARKAFGIEVDREDVYQTMMRVQYRAGQRTSAMETYFMCQKHLDEQLGIPLSRKTIEIYEKMLNEEDVQ